MTSLKTPAKRPNLMDSACSYQRSDAEIVDYIAAFWAIASQLPIQNGLALARAIYSKPQSSRTGHSSAMPLRNR